MATPSQDVKGKRVVCTTECKNMYGEVMVRVGERGKIEQVYADGDVGVVLEAGPSHSKKAPLSSFKPLDSAQQRGLLQVRWHAVPAVQALSRRVPAHASSTGPNDIRKHFTAFLTGVSEKRARIPNLQPKHTKWLADDATIKGTSTRIQNGILRCAPTLPSVMSRQDFTIHDVFAAGKPITKDNDNHTAGLYGRLYSNFKKGTEFYGLDPIPYFGQTNDIDRRSGSHDTDTWNKNVKTYNYHHYQVARAAGKTVAAQFFEHDENEGGSTVTGSGLRDIGEQLFIIMFSSYSARSLDFAERNQDAQLAQALSDTFADKELSAVYTEIAKLSLTGANGTGYALPGLSNRATSFGTGGGCNVTSPLGGEGLASREPRLWAVQEDASMWTFHRSAIKVTATGDLFKTYTQDSKATVRIATGSMYKFAANAPLPAIGDLVHTAWEIMKPGKGEHPAPFFRHPTLSGFPAASYANKSGFKVIFWKDGKCICQYIQPGPMAGWADDDTPASFSPFLKGCALYAYFTRAQWPDPPPNMPKYGLADLLKVSVDKSAGVVNVRRFTEPLVTLQGPGSKPNLQVARKQMRDVGLRNVDGPWQGFNWDWTTDPSSFPPGKGSYDQLTRGEKGRVATTKQRKKCDHCLLYVNMSHTQVKCERHENTNRCKLCVKRGLPCSWSPLPTLYGTDWFEETEKAGRTYVKNQISAKREKEFHRSTFIVAANTGQVIQDPGFRRVEEEV